MRNKIVLLLLLFGGLAFTEEVAPRNTTVIIKEIKEELNQLKTINENNKLIIEQRDNNINSLNEEVKNLIINLDKTVNDLSEANSNIIKQNERIRIQKKWLIMLTSILGVLTIAHFVILFIKLKFNIKLPYWLNTIL